MGGGGGDQAGHSKFTSYQMSLALLIAISGPKKAYIFRAHPFQWPSKWIFPLQNCYVRRLLSIKYIPTFSKSCRVAKPQLAFPARFNSTVAIKDVHHFWNGSIWYLCQPNYASLFSLYKEQAVFGKIIMDPAKRAQTQNAGDVSSLKWDFSNPLNRWRILLCCTA